MMIMFATGVSQMVPWVDGRGASDAVHILAMVLAVTLDLSGVQEHCKLEPTSQNTRSIS